jgi:polysaccharide pyruvyl transferase WcaK-like protein
MPQSSIRILITGYYYKQNLGDDLLLQYAQTIFRSTRNLIVIPRYLSTDTIEIHNKEAMDELIKTTDVVVLFGGEVINTYFLDRLIAMKRTAMMRHNKNIPFYAFGVSCNSDYQEIQSRMDLFEYVIFRNRTDYLAFLPRLTERHSEVLPDPVFAYCRKTLTGQCSMVRNIRKVSRYIRIASSREQMSGFHVGFFLCQTCRHPEFMNAIHQLLDKCIQRRARISLFTMCNGTIASEDDRRINKEVYDRIPVPHRHKVSVYSDPQSIFQQIGNLDVAVCWRFHAHVFCILYGIPFISLSTTPKVKTLLEENDLIQLSYAHRLNVLPDAIDAVLRNSDIIHRNLSQLTRRLHPLAKTYGRKWSQIIGTTRATPRHPMDDTIKTQMMIQIRKSYLIYERKEDHLYNAIVLLYLITGHLKTPYQWGLVEKMSNGATIDTLSDDIVWLIDEQVKTGSMAFYAKVYSYLHKNFSSTIPAIPSHPINIHYMDQNDMKGVHRSGWEYVIHHIERNMASLDSSAILCDLYLDRTFHWNYDSAVALGIIPYCRPWVGFIHHTSRVDYTDYNVVALFNKPAFINSLACCSALIVMTHYLRKQVEGKLRELKYHRIPVYVLRHPTEFIEASRCFQLEDFEQLSAHRIVQVGAWYRDISAIFRLNLNENPLQYQKCALKGPQMEGYYRFLQESGDSVDSTESTMQISRDNRDRSSSSDNTLVPLYNTVELLPQLSAEEYDRLFQLCIIFIYLIDASAVNTIIESIVRNTPILVNRIEPVVEYLGRDYPFYYDTLEEAARKANDIAVVRRTHEYLKGMDKSFLRVENFIRSFQTLPIFP